MPKLIILYSLLMLLVQTSNIAIGQDENLKVDFVSEIKPILESNCFRCHNEKESEGGYRIDIREDALEYVEAGDAESSQFYEYLISDDEDEMMPPPDDGGPLDDADIQLIKTWIDEGASWPDGVQLIEFQDADAGEAPAPDANQQPNKNDENKKVYRALGSFAPSYFAFADGFIVGGWIICLVEFAW